MGDSPRMTSIQVMELPAEDVCEEHREDTHLLCVEEQIPFCADCKEYEARDSHSRIPEEQTASTGNQETESPQKSRWKEDGSQSTTSGNPNTTPGFRGKGEILSGNEKDHTEEPMLMEQWVDFNFNNSKEEGTQSNTTIQNSIMWILLVIFIIQIVGLITTIFVFTMARPELFSSVADASCCPHGWIMTEGSCYHFLDLEGAWAAGQHHCSSLGASLAVINDLENLNVAVLHKGPFNHWVGLLREPGKNWKWLDGTVFNSHFEVEGEGRCAYLSSGVLRSADCSLEKKWLCSQRARKEGSLGYCRGT